MEAIKFFNHRRCMEAANRGELRVKCTNCRRVIDIDVATQPNLPNCRCGDTNWMYSRLAIDVLRYVKKLLP
jgi:hypothetical protein